MIIEYDDEGRITHMINDPVLPEVRAFYLGGEAGDRVHEIIIPTLDGHYFDADEGVVKYRPELSCTVPETVSVGQKFTITDVPAGSVASVTMAGGTPVEWTAGLTVDGAAINDLEFSEPGPVTIRIKPPFPMMEKIYAVQVVTA